MSTPTRNRQAQGRWTASESLVLMLDPRPHRFPREFALIVASAAGFLDEIGVFRPAFPDQERRLVLNRAKLAAWRARGAKVPDGGIAAEQIGEQLADSFGPQRQQRQLLVE